MDNLLNLLYFIEEEEILLNENADSTTDIAQIFQGIYLNKKVLQYFIKDPEIIEKETLLRIKYVDSYHLPLLGYSINSNSSLGEGFVFELGLNTVSLNTILTKNELSYDNKLGIISELIALYEFENSRNLFFQSLTINDIYLSISKGNNNNTSNKLSVLKFPLSINNYIDSLEKEKFLNLPPEIIRKNKKKLSEEDINSKTEAWNLGLLIFEILEGKHFILSEIEKHNEKSSEKSNEKVNDDKLSKQKISDYILKLANTTIIQKINSLSYNQYLKNLLKKLLKVEQKQRYCTKVIMQDFQKNFGIGNNNFSSINSVHSNKTVNGKSMNLNTFTGIINTTPCNNNNHGNNNFEFNDNCNYCDNCNSRNSTPEKESKKFIKT